MQNGARLGILKGNFFNYSADTSFSLGMV